MTQPVPLNSSAAAVAAPSAGGSYAVQVSSQRSEAEAQTSFRALQAKFPGQLGGQQPMVRRADLGTKGVYYRALVGPYASMEQAAGVCSSLKAAGGSCIVQRN
jgi:cell division septation protein DedD